MLTRAQHDAVRAKGHVLITACPGSGKTTVLKHRAAFLLDVDPDAVLCGVTFTSESAAELDRRIRSEVPDVGARLTCGTFHSLCKRQLALAGNTAVLVSETRSRDLLRRAWRETADETGASFDEAVAFVEHVKSQVNPILPASHANAGVLVYQRYQALLRQMGAMDFADLLVECVRGMADGTVEPVRTRTGVVTHMLVDEFQDTDSVQLAWVMEHIQHGVQVTVVGDDDQSIYGWRRALGYEGLEAFRQQAKARHIALDLTFRCAREILTPAARLIAHNTERVDKRLDTANRMQGNIRLHRCTGRFDEVDAVVRQVQRSGTPGQWGVLARTNAQLDHAEQVFTASGVPYRRSGGMSFWDYRAPALFLALCRSLGTGDMVGVDALLRGAGIAVKTLERIHSKCRSHQPGSLDRFVHSGGKGARGKLATLRRRITDWRALLLVGNARMAMEGIAQTIQHDVKLYNSAASPDVAARDKQMLRQCVDVLSRLRGNVLTRLAAIHRTGDREQDNAGCVRLMTLHASKGLEFDRVWILGCERGVLPSDKSPVEEERRLMYVGITRARQELHLSCVVSERSAPSAFLDEAGL